MVLRHSNPYSGHKYYKREWKNGRYVYYYYSDESKNSKYAIGGIKKGWNEIINSPKTQTYAREAKANIDKQYQEAAKRSARSEATKQGARQRRVSNGKKAVDKLLNK